MELEPTAKRVFDALADLPVIDAHQHLPPEAYRVGLTVDFFLLFCDPTRDDLISAGMDRDLFGRLCGDEMSAEQKWQAVRPFYPMVKHGSYFRPSLVWIREVLGHDDLNDDTYEDIGAQLQANNTAGLYQRVLGDMCHIEAALVSRDERDDYRSPLLRLMLWVNNWYPHEHKLREFIEERPSRSDHTLDAYLEWTDEHAEGLLDKVVGIKMSVQPRPWPDRTKARDAFRTAIDGLDRPSAGAIDPLLTAVVTERAIAFARKHELPASVHAGYWGDFRDLAPTLLIPYAQRYPDMHFDLFHLGVPYVREAVMVGKMLPNVSLNLCWDAVTSQEMTVRMLDECFEMLPVNNVIAFGGDYNLPVEKTYGHLKMAKECVARTLAKRIRQGRLDLDEAVRIARLWFYENPKRIYKLDPPASA